MEVGFLYFDIASVMVAENGELHTINHCEGCYDLRQRARGRSRL